MVCSLSVLASVEDIGPKSPRLADAGLLRVAVVGGVGVSDVLVDTGEDKHLRAGGQRTGTSEDRVWVGVAASFVTGEGGGESFTELARSSSLLLLCNGSRRVTSACPNKREMRAFQHADLLRRDKQVLQHALTSGCSCTTRAKCRASLCAGTGGTAELLDSLMHSRCLSLDAPS